MSDPDFDVVLLGQNLGVYTFARAVHEEYGLKPTVIAYQLTGPLMRTSIINGIEIGVGKGLPDILAKLRELADARRASGDPRRVLLTANSDGFVRFIAAHRADLEDDYVIPLTSLENLEMVSDKAEFALLAQETGIGHPRTVIQDFAKADDPAWTPAQITDFDFPVVAKASASAVYEGMSFPGKKKVFVADSQAELEAIWQTVREAGFRDRFVVQEMVPGDDTNMRWINCYRDRHGVLTTFASAQVLLEEHTPWNLGNPAAMITGPMPQAQEQIAQLLDHLDWVGFANFDGKVDPRDGELKVFEFNPRMGRANYAATAAGANVSRFVIEDFIHDRAMTPHIVTNEVLFSIVPTPLLLKYVEDPALRDKVKRLAKRQVARPFHNPKDNLWRKGYAIATELNHVRKFRKHYPWGQEHATPTAGGTAQ